MFSQQLREPPLINGKQQGFLIGAHRCRARNAQHQRQLPKKAPRLQIRQVLIQLRHKHLHRSRQHNVKTIARIPFPKQQLIWFEALTITALNHPPQIQIIQMRKVVNPFQGFRQQARSRFAGNLALGQGCRGYSSRWITAAPEGIEHFRVPKPQIPLREGNFNALLMKSILDRAVEGMASIKLPFIAPNPNPQIKVQPMIAQPQQNHRGSRIIQHHGLGIGHIQQQFRHHQRVTAVGRADFDMQPCGQVVVVPINDPFFH